MPKILIVEYDPQLTKILKLNLRIGDPETEHAGNFAEAWARIAVGHYDLVLVDIGLPDGSGLDLCQKVRESGLTVPIVFLNARTDETKVVSGIHHGTNTYLRKPFDLEELKVFVNRLIKLLVPEVQLVRFGALTIDPAKRIVTLMDSMLTLGRKELDILTLLARRAGDIVSREIILNTLYDNDDRYDRTVDSHMSHLRKKLREVAGSSLQISSIYGLGYRLEWKG